jgi:UDP-glucose 4-epimerase
MKILLTGGTGFVGKHLANFFVKKPEVTELIVVCRDKNHDKIDNVRYIYGDLADPNFVSSLFNNMQEHAKVRPDVILHFAANPSPRLDLENPDKILDDNIKATQNLLHYCHNPEQTYFVLASSVVVYGDGTNLKETDTLHPNNVYAVTKIASESLLLAYYHHRGINGASLRLPATVGDGLTHGMLCDFIRKAQLDGDEFEVFGNSPGVVKPYLHIDDLVKAVNLCVDNKISGTYNICPDDHVSVQDVAELVISRFSPDKRIKWLGDQWTGDTHKTHCSNKYFKHISQWKMEHSTSLGAIGAFIDEYTSK